MWQYVISSTWYCAQQKRMTQVIVDPRGSWECNLLCAYFCLGPQGPEASARWGGGGAVWGNSPRSSQPGQWLLWQGGLGLAFCFTTELAYCIELWYERLTVQNGVFNEMIWLNENVKLKITCARKKKKDLSVVFWKVFLSLKVMK